jgi:phage protein D
MAVAVPIPLFGEQPFRVPDFRLTLQNGQITPEVRRDVLSVTYRDSVNEIDSFELTVNNWDAERGRPKYDPPSAPEYEGVFLPGREVVLELGYVDELRVMTHAVITGLDASWSDGGATTLSVHGLNALHGLRRYEHSHSWVETTDSAIARWLGEQPRSVDRPGLGMEVRTSPREEQTHPHVHMHNQHDVVFLLERARVNDYEVVLHEPDETSRDRYLTFGPSEVTTPVYRLEWGKSLSSFRYSLDLSNQVGTMEVRGWDRRTNAPLVGQATLDQVNTDGEEQARMRLLRHVFDDRIHVEVDTPVRTPAEATSLAEDMLRRRLKEMLTASGATVGLPDLRAGRKVEIVGFRQQTQANQPPDPPNIVDGEYFVTETTHTVGDGYRTEFRARREGKARP